MQAGRHPGTRHQRHGGGEGLAQCLVLPSHTKPAQNKTLRVANRREQRRLALLGGTRRPSPRLQKLQNISGHDGLTASVSSLPPGGL